MPKKELQEATKGAQHPGISIRKAQRLHRRGQKLAGQLNHWEERRQTLTAQSGSSRRRAQAEQNLRDIDRLIARDVKRLIDVAAEFSGGSTTFGNAEKALRDALHPSEEPINEGHALLVEGDRGQIPDDCIPGAMFVTNERILFAPARRPRPIWCSFEGVEGWAQFSIGLLVTERTRKVDPADPDDEASELFGWQFIAEKPLADAVIELLLDRGIGSN